eukprot:331205-Lingulodinium_polyedra.AAC.1
MSYRLFDAVVCVMRTSRDPRGDFRFEPCHLRPCLLGGVSHDLTSAAIIVGLFSRLLAVFGEEG